MPVSTKLTHFPNGFSQFQFIGAGAAAGNVVCNGVLVAKDRILHVQGITLSGALLTDSDDYTSEFSVSADNQINNTGGTSTSGRILFVTVARKQ